MKHIQYARLQNTKPCASQKRKPAQLALLKAPPRYFGGQLLVGRGRRERPLSTKEPIHFVWKSAWAKGAYSFLSFRNKNFCEKAIQIWSKRYGVRIYRLAIASDHIHIVLRITNRALYRSFIRVTTSQIASHIMKGERFRDFAKRLGPSTSQSQIKEQRFWQFRPFSRVLAWGRDFKTTARYLLQNTLEALGHVAYLPRGASRYAREFYAPLSAGQLETG